VIGHQPQDRHFKRQFFPPLPLIIIQRSSGPSSAGKTSFHRPKSGELRLPPFGWMTVDLDDRRHRTLPLPPAAPPPRRTAAAVAWTATRRTADPFDFRDCDCRRPPQSLARRPPLPRASLHHLSATAAKTAAVVSHHFTLPEFRGRNASQKMSRRASKGVKRPRQQQGKEKAAEPAPSGLTAHPTLPLPLLSVVQSYHGMCVSVQLCDAQGAALFPFVRLPPRVRHPFAGAPVHSLSLTHGERLRVVGCGLTGKLVRLLSLGTGRSSTTTTSTVSITAAPTPITGTSTTTTITTTVRVTTHFPRHFEPDRNWRSCHKLMHFKVGRVAAKLMHSLAAAVGNKVGKEAEELYASGQCAAAAVALKLAMDLGHLPSRALLAHMLTDGREGVAKDGNKAFELVEEAQGARLGCHHCQGVMAMCYCFGYGCVRDTARSLVLARESSEKGSRYGQYVLSQLYRYGEGGVVEDHAQAVALYRLAAAQNLDCAQLSLGCVTEDSAEALWLFQLAAAQGHPTAFANIAYCHKHGEGVRKNKAEAIRWYRRAQAAGDIDAAAQLQKLRA
jgi:hypothetical protein